MKTQKTTENQEQLEEEMREYIEVLGDTVSGKHMIITIIVSGFLGLGGFLLGMQIFPKIAPENMINSYSLLLGIAGLVIALVINSLIFLPKRKLITEEGTGEKVAEIFEDYGLNIDEEREAIKSNPVVQNEMKEQGIYNMFFPNKEDRS